MKKFAIGCAVVAGVALITIVIGGVMIARNVQQAMPDTEEFDRVSRLLVERDGPLMEAVLPVDGSIDPESLARYVEVQEHLQARIVPYADELEELLGHFEGEAKGLREKFRRVTSVSKGVFRTGVAVVELSAVADSLLLEHDVSKAEYAYFTGLVRFGVLDWSPPRLSDLDATEGGESTRGEVEEMLDGFEQEFERVVETLLVNQRRELRGRDVLDPRETEWLATLDEVLRQRSELDGLRGRLMPWQVEAIEIHRDRLSRLLPARATAYFFDLVTCIDEDDESGVTIQLGD